MPDDGRRERGLDEIVRPGPSLARVGETGGSRARRAGRFRRVGNRHRALGRAAGAIAKKHAPFGAVALRIFCAPRVTRAALFHDAERDAAASRAPSATPRAIARVRPTQTRPAFATARTGVRARTDPFETRTPRAVPFGIGVVTRHAPSVAASITSSSLLLLKRGRLESRRPAGRRGRVCGRRRGGSVWVSLRPTRPREKPKSASEAAEPGRFLPEVRTTRERRAFSINPSFAKKRVAAARSRDRQIVTNGVAGESHRC